MGFTSIKSLNMTAPNNMTSSANMTGSNMTTSDTSGSSAKMHLEQGIKALKSGDNQAAMIHLNAAKQVIVAGEATNDFEQEMKALENGDSNGASNYAFDLCGSSPSLKTRNYDKFNSPNLIF
jgi:hypothetical protein